MIKMLFKKRFFLNLTVVAFLCALLICCLRKVEFVGLTLDNAFLMARESFSMDVFMEKDYGVEATFTLINFVIFIPFIASIFSYDYDIAKNYIFVRMKSAGTWYMYKTLQCFAYCLFACTAYNVFILALVAAFGCGGSSVKSVLYVLLFSIFSSTLLLFDFTMLSNTLSIKFKPHFCACFASIAALEEVVRMNFLYDYQMQTAPLMQYYVSWHIFESTNPVSHPHSALFYYGVLSLFAIAEVLTGSIIIKKIDYI